MPNITLKTLVLAIIALFLRTAQTTEAANVSLLVTWKTQTANYAAVGVGATINLYASDNPNPIGTITVPSAGVTSNSGIYMKTVTISVDDSYLRKRVYISITPQTGGYANIPRYSEFATAVLGGVQFPEYGTEALTRTGVPTDTAIYAAANVSVAGQVDATSFFTFGTIDSDGSVAVKFEYSDPDVTTKFLMNRHIVGSGGIWKWAGYDEEGTENTSMILKNSGVLSLYDYGSNNNITIRPATGEILFNGDERYVTNDSHGNFPKLAVGGGTVTNGVAAIGWESQATGGRSLALGDSAIASGWESVAVGGQASSTSGFSIAIGEVSMSVSNSAIAMGVFSSAGLPRPSDPTIFTGAEIALGSNAYAYEMALLQ